jgi:hypothetical protein
MPGGVGFDNGTYPLSFKEICGYADSRGSRESEGHPNGKAEKHSGCKGDE